MAEAEEDASALKNSVVRAWAWRMATAGNSPEKIADEINARFGKGQPITDAVRIAENVAKERAYRNSAVQTPEEAVRRLIDMVELVQGELTIARTNFDTQPQDHGPDDGPLHAPRHGKRTRSLEGRDGRQIQQMGALRES